MHAYSTITFSRDSTPAFEPIEVVWLYYSNQNMFSRVDSLTFDGIHEKGMLNEPPTFLVYSILVYKI